MHTLLEKEGNHGKVVIPLSGGIDSTLLLGVALDRQFEPVPIIIDDDSFEQKYKTNLVATAIAQHYGLENSLVSLNTMQSKKLEYKTDSKFPDVGYIPGYKVVMNLIAMSYAAKIGAKEVWIGNMADNVYEDETDECLAATEELFNKTYSTRIKLVQPLKGLTKAQVVKMAECLDVPLEITMSCGNDAVLGKYNCGVCDWCKKRRQAFIDAGVEDKSRYLW